VLYCFGSCPYWDRPDRGFVVYADLIYAAGDDFFARVVL